MQDNPGNVRLSLFGHFALTSDGETLTQFSYDKVKALLVYLLLHGRQPASRAALAEMLWPDQGVSSGRTNLRHALHCLRQSLGEDADQVLSVSRQTIALTLPTAWSLDLSRVDELLGSPPSIDSLESLLKLYPGDLVEELHLPQCGEFQRWLLKERGEWRQRVIEFAESVLASESRVPDVVLRQLVSRFSGYGPFHERLVRQLAEQGQAAAAHEQFNAYLQLLALSGQQPEPGFLQLARYWSDNGLDPASEVTPQGAFSRVLSLDSAPLHPGEIEHRQLSVMAIRLHLQGDWQDRSQICACLTLQLDLMRWLERQCRHLGGFWLPGATGGLGLACFGTHGPAHQLAELVALYEHCRQQLPEETGRYWSGEGEAPCFELSAGLHSGQVVYLPERQLADPLGQVTQPALELMSAAQGSELVISQDASQHMPPALDLQPRLSSRLISADGRVRLRALVLGTSESGRKTALPSLIGREGALRQLRDALARVGIGLRQSVLVQGAAGMGKSALMVSFRQLEESKDLALCWLPATRLLAQAPFGVARVLLRWHFGRDLDEASLQKLLEAQPLLSGLTPERMALLRGALGISEAAPEETIPQNGEVIEWVVRTLHGLVEQITAAKPLVLMIDDLQWVDEPSLKVLAGLQVRLPINSPFLFMASHHGREPLPIRLHWDQQVVLERLDAMQSSRLLSHLARRYRLHLSPRLRGQLIERCDGVPLYLQEICRRLDMDRREGRSFQPDELPRGLLGLLASRIDQLEGDRSVAHVAAVLGRQIRLSLLRECTGLEESRLKQVIDHMRRLEIIEPCTPDSEFEYEFTHQLLQEAAYLSCPRDVRTRTHQQIVSLIEERFPAWISRRPGYFATHLHRSGHYARGARYFELAAREALKVSANRTALQMADAGLASLRHIETGQAEREISLLTVRGQAAFALEGYGSPLAHDSFVQARKLLSYETSGPDDEPDLEQFFLVKWGLWVGCSQRHAHADAFSLASRLASLADQLADPRYRRLADYAQAHCEYWAGRIRHAYEHLEEIDPLHQPMMLDWLPFSDHPQVAAACYQGWTQCLRGEYRRAEQQAEAAIRLAETLNHPGSLAMALLFAAAMYRQLGHIRLAKLRAERAYELTRTPDLHLWHVSAQGALGWCQVLSGDRGGLGILETSMEQFAEVAGQDRYQRPFLLYGDACLALGEYARGEDYVDQCLMVARERNTLYLPELSMQLARIRHHLGYSSASVRTLAEQALGYAREHENRHHQLNALELWLTLVNPGDVQVREEFARLLRQVSMTDAPVLMRWRALSEQSGSEVRARLRQV
ncbi:AAA family ATPase [Halomonas shantousis]